jgi:hypothetical protein
LIIDTTGFQRHVTGVSVSTRTAEPNIWSRSFVDRQGVAAWQSQAWGLGGVVNNVTWIMLQLLNLGNKKKTPSKINQCFQIPGRPVDLRRLISSNCERLFHIYLAVFSYQSNQCQRWAATVPVTLDFPCCMNYIFHFCQRFEALISISLEMRINGRRYAITF